MSDVTHRDLKHFGTEDYLKMALQVHCGSARPRTPGSFSLVSEGDADFPGVDHSLLLARRGYNSRHPETSPGQGGRHSQTAATRNGNPSRFLAVLRPTRPFRAHTTQWSRGRHGPPPACKRAVRPPRPQRPPRWPHECLSTVLLPRPAPRGAEGPPGPGLSAVPAPASRARKFCWSLSGWLGLIFQLLALRT